MVASQIPVEVVHDTMPQCVKDVKKFLGLANYYWCFVKDFAKVALPINKLTRKDKK